MRPELVLAAGVRQASEDRYPVFPAKAHAHGEVVATGHEASAPERSRHITLPRDTAALRHHRNEHVAP